MSRCEAVCERNELRAHIAALVAALEQVRALAQVQADASDLWFPVGNPGTQVEQLQLALRRLHGLIEGEPTPWLEDRKDGGT